MTRMNLFYSLTLVMVSICSSEQISFETYPNLDTIVNYMRGIERDYPDIVTLESIGEKAFCIE